MSIILSNIVYPMLVAVVGGVIVSLIEYFIIQPAKEKATTSSGYYGEPRRFQMSWKTVIGGIVGAIVIPILLAFMPDWKKAILEAFNFATSSSDGSVFIAIMGVVVGCLIGSVYKQAIGAVMFALVYGIGAILIIWMVGGVFLSLFNFGKWDYIGQILSGWSSWGFWIGIVLGAVIGTQAGDAMF